MNELGERSAKSPNARPKAGPTARPTDGVHEPAPRSAPIAASDRVVTTTIDADDVGQRLDNYLVRRAKGVPKSHLYRIIRGGEVRINRGRVDADYRLRGGDVLRMPPLRVAVREPARESPVRRERPLSFRIVFEDDHLCVVDKPAGIAVHGGSGISFGVIEQMRESRPDAAFLELAHRIDRETSGLLMIAKKRSALTRLHADLREGRVDKRYLACVAGRWPDARRTLKAPLVKFVRADGERRVRVADATEPAALDAQTIVRRIESFDGPLGAFALLDVELKTGRTHQIRVHLAHVGRPIVGDDKYGDFAINHAMARRHRSGAGLHRMFLHAAHLRLAHPATGDRLALESPLPEECARFLATLRASLAAT